jgi:hypothetical protein
MRDMGMTDEMVTPSDETTMPTLKVGLIHPQPNYTSFGKGAKLAQVEINAAGGILNMQVELSFREETTDTVVQSATELAEMEGVVAILGPLFSSHAVKVGPVINIPVLLGATRAEVTADATDPNDFINVSETKTSLFRAGIQSRFSELDPGSILKKDLTFGQKCSIIIVSSWQA